MDARFWHDRWNNNEIAFHEQQVNRLLTRFVPALPLMPGERVFVPLCGKTRDIHWLLSNGYRVAGAELSPLAVGQLFDELELKPEISEAGPLRRHSAPRIDIFAGDVFDLTRDLLGRVDAIYDRAALVALPEDMRRRYAAHMVEITATARQLLICYLYDQSTMAGPPFAIGDDEIGRHYGKAYVPTLLEDGPVPGGLKGNPAVREKVWLLQPL